MIRNKNVVFGKANSNSSYSDRVFQLPKLATGDLTTAASANEGGIAYDSTLQEPVVSTGSAWLPIGLGASSPSA